MYSLATLFLFVLCIFQFLNTCFIYKYVENVKDMIYLRYLRLQVTKNIALAFITYFYLYYLCNKYLFINRNNRTVNNINITNY
jgi:hypothetical protein